MSLARRDPFLAAALGAWCLLSWHGGLHAWQGVAAACLLWAGSAGRRVSPGPVESRLALALGAALLGGLAVAVAPQAHVDGILLLAGALGLFMGARRSPYWTPERATSMLLLLGSVTACAFLAIGFSGLGASRATDWSGPVLMPHLSARWLSPNQNILAAGILAPALLAAVAGRLAGRRGALMAGVLVGLGLVYAGSRGALVALAAGLGWMLLRSGFQKRMAAAALTVVLLLGVLTWKSPFSRLAHRLQEQSQASTRDDNYFRRKDFWSGALSLSLGRPWLGHGLGGFETAARRLDLPVPLTPRQPIARYRMTLEHAHNEWLELAVELGWPAAGLALGLALLWLVRRWRRRDVEPAVLALEGAMVAALAHSMLDMNLRTPGILAGLALVLAALEPRSDPAPRTGPTLRPLWALLAVAALGLVAARTAEGLPAAGNSPWLTAAGLLRPLDARVQALRLRKGLAPWPWADWTGREDWAWHWARAEQAGRDGRGEDAILAARQALERRPTWAPGWQLLGMQEERSGHSAAASDCMRRAVELEPNFARVWGWECDRLIKEGNFAEAKTLLRKVHAIAALKLEQEDADAYTAYIQAVDPEWLKKRDKTLHLSTVFGPKS